MSSGLFTDYLQKLININRAKWIIGSFFEKQKTIPFGLLSIKQDALGFQAPVKFPLKIEFSSLVVYIKLKISSRFISKKAVSCSITSTNILSRTTKPFWQRLR